MKSNVELSLFGANIKALIIQFLKYFEKKNYQNLYLVSFDHTHSSQKPNLNIFPDINNNLNFHAVIATT